MKSKLIPLLVLSSLPLLAACSGRYASCDHMGMHHDGHSGHHGHNNLDGSSGWSMMTPAERKEHHERMGSMKTHAECVTYMDTHHQRMLVRAKEMGLDMPARPLRDACASMMTQ